MKEAETSPRRVSILGAAGRDFHDFETYFRGDPRYGSSASPRRRSPTSRIDATPHRSPGIYPAGVPTRAEEDLEALISEHDVHQCVLSYSDLKHEAAMSLASPGCSRRAPTSASLDPATLANSFAGDPGELRQGRSMEEEVGSEHREDGERNRIYTGYDELVHGLEPLRELGVSTLDTCSTSSNGT